MGAGGAVKEDQKSWAEGGVLGMEHREEHSEGKKWMQR